MSSDLVVVLNSEIAGVISHDSGKPRFAYIDDYVTASDQTPLSLSVPLRLGHLFGPRTTSPWLQGLLPDDPLVRRRWAHKFGVSPDNPAALLQHAGRDCAGAVQITPVDTLQEMLHRRGHYEPTTDIDIGTRLRDLLADPGDWARHQERWSLAGAQSKFTVTATTDGGWAWPRGSVASTHIVKPGIAQYRGQALNEHLCQKALSLIGIHAAQTAYHEFDGTPAIVITRYDRILDADGTVTRIHQEDMCQALGVAPDRKYTADGGPSAVAIANLLGDKATQDDVDRFTDAVVVQYLLCAPDAHAKNYSVILSGDQVALAPVYDVASVVPYQYDPRDDLGRVAMPIGGYSRYGEVKLRHIERFAVSAGTDPDRLVATTRRMAAALPDALSDAASDIPSRSLGSLADELRSGIATHCGTLDSPPSSTGRGRRTIAADAIETAAESALIRDAEPLDDTVPVVDYFRGGRPVSSHRRRRPTSRSD